MGRKYVCDYCGKRIQNDPNIIKKHNEGLPHLRAKAEHYEQFKELEQILKQAIHKLPCRSLKDQSVCMFGILCRFRHYTTTQIEAMQRHVEYTKLCQRNKFNMINRKLRNVEVRTEQFIFKRCANQGCEPEGLPPSLQTSNRTKVQTVVPNKWG